MKLKTEDKIALYLTMAIIISFIFLAIIIPYSIHNRTINIINDMERDGVISENNAIRFKEIAEKQPIRHDITDVYIFLCFSGIFIFLFLPYVDYPRRTATNWDKGFDKQ